MSPWSALIVIVLGAFAIYCDYRRPGWFRYAKGLPILYLIIQVGAALFLTSTPVIVFWIFGGLVLGLVGDLLLLKKEYFLQGLSVFLLGHVLYVFALSGDFTLNPAVALPLAVFGAGFSAVLFYYLWKSGREGYLVPVLLYIVTICFMVVYGIQFDQKTYGLPRAFAVGAVLFAFSDSLLSINRFVKPFREAQLLVLSSYYAAQLCLAAGALAFV